MGAAPGGLCEGQQGSEWHCGGDQADNMLPGLTHPAFLLGQLPLSWQRHRGVLDCGQAERLSQGKMDTSARLGLGDVKVDNRHAEAG